MRKLLTFVSLIGLASSGFAQGVSNPGSLKNLNGIRFADQYSSIQAAIDEAFAAGGGRVIVGAGNHATNLTLKSNVTLEGAGGEFETYNTGLSVITDASSGASAVITVANGASGWAIRHLRLVGHGSGASDRGIYIPNATRGTVEWVSAYHFGEEGIRWEAGLALEINHVQTVQCLLNRSRSTYSGTVYMGGADGRINYSELTASTSIEGNLISANQYVDALVLAGSNTWVTSTNLEISDMGLYVAPGSSGNKITDCRMEFNYGHGALFEGAATIIGSKADTNSLAADNTYDGFKVTGGNVTMIGNTVLTTAGWRVGGDFYHKYGFEDTQTSDSNKNRYVGNTLLALGTGTAAYKLSNNHSAAVTLGDAPGMSVTGATPSVAGFTEVVLGHSSPTTITNFMGGLDGQHLYLHGNPNVTIQHNGATIFTANGANEVLEGSKFYHFINAGGVWYEIGMPKIGVFNGGVTTPAQFTSTMATGTPPFVVASTTEIANLHAATATNAGNADTVDSVHAGNVSAGHAMCWKDSIHMGHCSSVVAADGTCTCN